jgi:hypothetical protein
VSDSATECNKRESNEGYDDPTNQIRERCSPPADCAVKVVVNAIANVGAIMSVVTVFDGLVSRLFDGLPVSASRAW